MVFSLNHPLKKLTSFKQAGLLKQLYEFQDLETLQHILPLLPQYHILGAGSNILFNPSTPAKPIIKLSPAFGLSKQLDATTMSLPGGLSIQQALRILGKHQLSGLEFGAGVPASIGGMTAMNFGCWGYEISDWIKSVHIMYPNGKTQWLSKKACHFGYRSSNILNEKWLVLEVAFCLKPTQTETYQKNLKAFLKRRQDSQPLELCSFGSIFKNPFPLKAGKILEDCDAKLLQKGHISISNKHANFLINNNPGEGSFEDAMSIINTLQKTVLEKTKQHLELEVKII